MKTGADTKMVRAYGRGPRGERLVCKQPWGHWKTTTFTAGLRCDGLVAPMVLDGPMTGEAFLAYVEQILLPTLTQGAGERGLDSHSLSFVHVRMRQSLVIVSHRAAARWRPRRALAPALLIEDEFVVVANLAATNKCLARSNKSRTRAEATKKRKRRRGAIWCAGQVSQRQEPLSGRRRRPPSPRSKNAGHNGMITTGMTYGLAAWALGISSIPLLFILWGMVKSSIRTRDLVFLGLLGLLFLIQGVSSLIGPNVIMGLIYILAGVR